MVAINTSPKLLICASESQQTAPRTSICFYTEPGSFRDSAEQLPLGNRVAPELCRHDE